MQPKLFTLLASAITATIMAAFVFADIQSRVVAEPPPITLYVWPASPAPSPPFASWATAAHTVQDAVDAAPAGATVLVTNGIYATGGRAASQDGAANSLANRVAITKSIQVRSINGASETLLVGAASDANSGVEAMRCVYVA